MREQFGSPYNVLIFLFSLSSFITGAYTPSHSRCPSCHISVADDCLAVRCILADSRTYVPRTPASKTSAPWDKHVCPSRTAAAACHFILQPSH